MISRKLSFIGMKFSWQSAFLCSLFLQYSDGLCNETAKLVPFQYELQSSPVAEVVEFAHVGRDAATVIRQDLEAADFDLWTIEREIHDMDIENVWGYTLFFIQPLDNSFCYIQMDEPWGTFPGCLNEANHVYGRTNWGNIMDATLHSPMGLDAYHATAGASIVVYIADRGDNEIEAFSRHGANDDWWREPTISGAQIPPNCTQPALHHPVDVAFYRRVPGTGLGPHIIGVLTWDGSALVTYDPETGDFLSSYGLPTAWGYDGHPGFLSGARSVISMSQRFYVCDTGHGRIVEFAMVESGANIGQLSVANVYDLGPVARPYAICTNDEGTEFYVADQNENRILKFVPGPGSYLQPRTLLQVDRIGDAQLHSMQFNEPKGLALWGEDLYVSEKYTATSGLVHGKSGAMISEPRLERQPDDSRFFTLTGTATGQIENLIGHLQPVNGGSVLTRGMFEPDPGPFRAGSGAAINMPIELYNVWFTYESASCVGECREPEEGFFQVSVGILPDLEQPVVSNCNGLGYPPAACWNQLQYATNYRVTLNAEGENSNVVTTMTPSYNIPNSVRGTVYNVCVEGIQNQSYGSMGCALMGWIAATPASVAIQSRSSTQIILTASLPEGTNATRVYYGTNPNQLTTYKDFSLTQELSLSFASNELSHHDQIWLFQISGLLKSSNGTVVSEGNRSNVIQAPLSPTTSGTISWPERWFAEYDPVVSLSNDINVASGASLTIDPGVVMNAGQNTIAVYGNLNATGTQGDHIFFVGSQPQITSATLVSFPAAHVQLQNTEFSGGYFGYLARGGNVTISDCSFEQNRHGLVMIDGAPTLENSDFLNNYVYGAVIVRSEPLIQGCKFDGNGRSGLLVWNTDYTTLYDSEFEGNGIAENPTAWSNGIRMLNGHVWMRCCAVKQNAGPGVGVLQGYLDNNWYDLQGESFGAKNIFSENVVDSVELGTHLGQVWLEGAAAFNSDYALNTFGGSTFIGSNAEYGAEDPGNPGGPQQIRLYYDFYLRGNYWGTTNQNLISQGLPAHSVFTPWQTQQWLCSEPVDPILPVPDSALAIFNAGVSQEFTANFDDAVIYYKRVIEDYPTSKQAPIALQRIAVCSVHEGETWPEVRNYFLSLKDSIDPTIRAACLNTAAWCLVEMGDMQAAAAEFQMLIDSSLKDYEVVYNSMGKLMSQLEEENWGSLGTQTGSKTSKSNMNLKKESNQDQQVAQLRKYTKTLAQTIEGIDSVLGIATGHQSLALVPTTYALYQNYPNPFNPSTEIRFDLPEAIRVELKIFNILGQEVAILVDDVRNAGAYRILWDGKNAGGLSVASGVYVYQLKTGNFQDAKKMVLIR